jgi:hypothetical protein
MATTVRFTVYARKRLDKRRISEELVLTVVRNPEQLIDERGRRIAQTRWTTARGTEHLRRVVYEESGSDILIVTVYDASKIQKYWRG